MARWNPVEQIQDLVNKMGGEENIKRFLSGELRLVPANQPPLLTPVTTITVPETATTFSAKKTFGAKKPAITLWNLGDTFKRGMLGKNEQDVPATTLTAHILTKDSLDAPILTEVGDKSEVALAHVWYLLTQQPNGESGFLLTNSLWNIFYVRGTDGNLWAVNVSWVWGAGGGWDVSSNSVNDPGAWRAGYQVVSR